MHIQFDEQGGHYVVGNLEILRGHAYHSRFQLTAWVGSTSIVTYIIPRKDVALYNVNFIGSQVYADAKWMYGESTRERAFRSIRCGMMGAVLTGDVCLGPTGLGAQFPRLSEWVQGGEKCPETKMGRRRILVLSPHRKLSIGHMLDDAELTGYIVRRENAEECFEAMNNVSADSKCADYTVRDETVPFDGEKNLPLG